MIPFRDRIVQHLLYGYLLPLFEPQWIHDSYANRVGKGTLFGIRRVERMMRSCSQQYTQDARVLKCDIQSCFMSMDRRRVWQLITTRVFAVSVPRDKSLILSLVSTGLFHDYMRDRDDHTTPYLRSLLPYHKSMLACKSYCCLPLGNLTSHLYANIILHQLDLYIKHELKIYHYGRYVDDFVCFHVDHHYLRRCITKIATFLMSIGLQLHPDKIYVQDYRHGIVFL